MLNAISTHVMMPGKVSVVKVLWEDKFKTKKQGSGFLFQMSKLFSDTTTLPEEK